MNAEHGEDNLFFICQKKTYEDKSL